MKAEHVASQLVPKASGLSTAFVRLVKLGSALDLKGLGMKNVTLGCTLHKTEQAAKNSMRTRAKL